VKVFKEKAEIKKDIAEDANTRLVNARKNANETFDDIKAENKSNDKTNEEVDKSNKDWKKNASKVTEVEGVTLDKPDKKAVKEAQA